MDASFTGRSARRVVRDLVDLLVELIYPPECLVCGAAGLVPPDPLCADCRRRLVPIGRRGCRKCGSEPRPGGPPRPSACFRCRGRRFAFRRAVAGLRYGGVARDVVLAVKFGGRREGIPVLAERLCSGLTESGLAARAGIVVPVPLHPLRRLARGFDQAEALAREVASRLALPVVPGALRRRRFTRPQARRAPAERGRAMDGAFGRGRRARRVRGRAVLLIDDVLTSGATVDAAARALLRAGARTVDVGVAAT